VSSIDLLVNEQCLMFTAVLATRGGATGGGSTDGQMSSETLQRERDIALDELKSVENSFADLHRRYEKLRLSGESSKKVELLIFLFLLNVFCVE
jgi:hypothetical protein